MTEYQSTAPLLVKFLSGTARISMGFHRVFVEETTGQWATNEISRGSSVKFNLLRIFKFLFWSRNFAGCWRDIDE